MRHGPIVNMTEAEEDGVFSWHACNSQTRTVTVRWTLLLVFRKIVYLIANIHILIQQQGRQPTLTVKTTGFAARLFMLRP